MRALARLLCLPVLISTQLLAGCSSGGDDDGSAHIRLLNASPGYDSLDLYVTPDDEDTDVLRFTGVQYGALSEYTTLDADSYTFKFRRNGVSSTLRTMSDQLGKDAYGTYIAYGSVGRFGVLEMLENNGDADSGRAWLQVHNIAEAGSLDVYLTESSVSLDDASPTFAALASGASSSGTTLYSGDYRLRVTGANDVDDLRLDVPLVSLTSKGNASLILTATNGGVLVNALFVPQRGSVIAYANTMARVRGAVGVGGGQAVTARVGGVSLLSNAAVGVVGAYTQVQGGSAAISLIVGGTPTDAPAQSLTAGGDYTLAIWTNANGVQTTMLSDDNRLPAGSGKAKIRLVNALSTHGAPLSLAVDFSPIVEGVLLGQTSSHVEVDGSGEYQLDVSDASTSANLLTKSSVTLQSMGVYTMFVAGAGGSVIGTLRKDR